jgi:hypothetical protein
MVVDFVQFIKLELLLIAFKILWLNNIPFLGRFSSEFDRNWQKMNKIY